MGDKVEFLPADKHKRFLQDGSITLGVISQTGPKYQKQSVHNIFAISQGKHEFLMKVARHVQSNQKRKFVKFYQYIKKKYCNCFCVLLWCKTFRYFSSHNCCYLVLGGCGQKWTWPFRSWNSEICCISKELIDKMSWFFACWYKVRKANVNLVITG